MHCVYFTLAVAAGLQAPQAPNVCTEAWPDRCPPAGDPALPGCHPYAPPPTAPWLAVRAGLINALFGVSDGQLPSAPTPDHVLPVPGATSRGCWCSTLGNCDASSCAWASNMTQLIHTISVPVNASFTLTLNSTVFWTLNTSGVAPLMYGTPLEPGFPPFPQPPTRRSDTLVVLHQGHNAPCVLPGGDPDYDGSVDWLNQLGYDVMNHHMPTFQPNANNPYGVACDHAWFAQFEAQGAPVIGRFFLEPVVRSINYAVGVLGYKRVVMTGLSGGGWTTTLLAAIDPRIALSAPVAGSLPCDFQHTSWDFEQCVRRALPSPPPTPLPLTPPTHHTPRHKQVLRQ